MSSVIIEVKKTTQTEAEWDNNENYLPQKNEIVIYTDNNNNNNIIGQKIGDGETVVKNLPFLLTIKENTSEVWEEQKNTYKPKANEIVVYLNNNEIVGKKRGDGKTVLNNLPFFFIKTDITIKTESDWNNNKNYKPSENEMVYYLNNNDEIIGKKWGDGKTLLKDLPFIGYKIYSSYVNENDNYHTQLCIYPSDWREPYEQQQQQQQ